jgi:hypothetical protein
MFLDYFLIPQISKSTENYQHFRYSLSSARLAARQSPLEAFFNFINTFPPLPPFQAIFSYNQAQNPIKTTLIKSLSPSKQSNFGCNFQAFSALFTTFGDGT